MKSGWAMLEEGAAGSFLFLGRDVVCALFVGLDVANLAAVGTLPLGSSGFTSAWGSGVVG